MLGALSAVRGSESISRILDVIDKVNDQTPVGEHRWAIEHAETISEPNIDRILALGGGVAIQDRMAFLGDDFLKRYGPEAAAVAPPLRSLVEKGIPLGIGTDGTRGSSFNPWVTLHWLTAGKTEGGTEIYPPENRLTREEALRAYTLGSAWFSGEEEVKGRIALGQYADFALLSSDFFSVSDEELKRIESVLTVVDGEVVWGAAEYEGLAPEVPEIIPEWSPVARFGVYWSS